MKKYQKGFAPLLIVLLVGLVLAGGAYYFLKNKSELAVPYLSPSPSLLAISTYADTTTWKTYTDPQFDYSIKYPSDKYTNCFNDEFFLLGGKDNGKFDCDIAQTVPDFNITVNKDAFGYSEQSDTECYSVKSENVSINGIVGEKLIPTIKDKTGKCAGYPRNLEGSESYLLTNRSDKFYIYFVYFNSEDHAQKEQILSTLILK